MIFSFKPTQLHLANVASNINFEEEEELIFASSSFLTRSQTAVYRSGVVSHLLCQVSVRVNTRGQNSGHGEQHDRRSNS